MWILGQNKKRKLDNPEETHILHKKSKCLCHELSKNEITFLNF
jgi:hypothetical protein